MNKFEDHRVGGFVHYHHAVVGRHLLKCGVDPGGGEEDPLLPRGPAGPVIINKPSPSVWVLSGVGASPPPVCPCPRPSTPSGRP